MRRLGKPATLVLGIVTILGGLLVGLVVVIARLISAFGDVAFVEASARAQVLSDRISTAMVYGVLSGGGVALVGVALVVSGTLRAPSSRPPPTRSS